MPLAATVQPAYFPPSAYVSTIDSSVDDRFQRVFASDAWHKQSIDVNTLDLFKVWQRMDVAHDYMRDCFNAALSTSTLNLFEPIDDAEGT